MPPLKRIDRARIKHLLTHPAVAAFVDAFSSARNSASILRLCRKHKGIFAAYPDLLSILPHTVLDSLLEDPALSRGRQTAKGEVSATTPSELNRLDR
jgi:hypothetical protein